MARRKKKHISRYKLFLSAVTIAALVTAFAFIKPSLEEKDKEVELPCLNDTITNAMSEVPELEGLDRKVRRFLTKWHLKGASLAITRNDSLVYAKGYGWADEELGIAMEPGHILRMASVSKLITAIGIMKLQDEGLLTIEDKVFGEEGILNDPFFTELTSCDKNYNKVTVEHLMRHQTGFRRDPLFSSNDVQAQLRLDHTPSKEDYYGLVLSRKLRWVPGTSQKYSNFGYLLLSEIIEKVSGMPYEQYIKEHVLESAGCYDMHIAGIYYEDRRENEVRYYTHEGDGKYIAEYNGSGKMVERCYGGTNLPLLSGAGAWCGSPIEIARLVASVNGNDVIKDIISSEAIDQMIEYYDPNTFSLGWNDTTPSKGWSRTGTLAGTNALVRHYPDGECWIIITNTSTYKGPGFSRYTEALFRDCRSLYSDKLPKKNLFI